MATITPNLGLTLPGYTDIADVEVLDNDFAAIDSQVERLVHKNAASGYPGLDASGDVLEHGSALKIVYTGIVEEVSTVSSSGTALTLPATASFQISDITLTGNCTLAFPSAIAGASFTLVLRQDSIGSRTVSWPASVKWPGGTVPTLTTSPNRADILTFLCTDGTYWFGFFAERDY